MEEESNEVSSEEESNKVGSFSLEDLTVEEEEKIALYRLYYFLNLFGVVEIFFIINGSKGNKRITFSNY